MAKAKVINLIDHPEVDEAKFSGAMVDMRNESTEAHSRTVALANALGYADELSIGALEDGIRFWQRRTVDACLEVGKRLLLLKESTPHGQFGQRLEMLGVGYHTANRFMNAALKTSKSCKLQDLSKQVKQVSMFMELITQDDDVIERLAELDDVSRMAPSELRKALRDARAEVTAKEAVAKAKTQRIHELEEQVVYVQRRPMLKATKEKLKEFAGAEAECKGVISGVMRQALLTLQDDGADHRLRMAGALVTLEAEIRALRDEFGLPDLSGQEIPDWVQAAQTGEEG